MDDDLKEAWMKAFAVLFPLFLLTAGLGGCVCSGKDGGWSLDAALAAGEFVVKVAISVLVVAAALYAVCKTGRDIWG